MMPLRPPTDLEREQLLHMIDPAVQAYNREYYLRNRKLKGRKKGRATKPSSDRKFLDATPMRQEGRSAAEVAKFVRSLEGLNDAQLKARIKQFKAADAKSATPSPAGGLEAMTAEMILNKRSGRSTSGGWRDPRTGKTIEVIAKEARARQRKELGERVQRLEDKLKKLEARIREEESKARSEDRKGKAKSERAAKERDKPKTAAEKAEAARENEKYREKNQQKLKNKANDSKSGGDSSSTSKGKSGKGSSALSELKALKTKVTGQIAVAKQKLAAL